MLAHMADFVLVHGAWHGAWCWENVVPRLEAAGHAVRAVDLPGHGNDRSPVSEMTLENNARTIVSAVSSFESKVLLVGHSMGGMSVTQAAELVPDRLERLVYVTAFLPANGQSLPELAADDPGTLVLPNLIPDEGSGTCTIAANALMPAFYGDCSEEDTARAIARLVPESLAAVGGSVSITDERNGSVPRVYIECTADQAISITRQREMHSARPCEQVLTIETDHSPFYSAVDELAELLLGLA